MTEAKHGLRPYQEEAVRAALTRLRKDDSTLIVMPTGTGKTQCFVSLADRFAKRTLIITHRDEIIEQARARIRQMLDVDARVEKAEQRAPRDSRYVVGSIQTLHGRRLAAWPRDHFGLVIVDEAHHAVADSYRAALQHFSQAKLLGVTATPDRLDAKSLGRIFESVAYLYLLTTAIHDGWLARLVARRVTIKDMDLSVVSERGGDLAQNELDEQVVRGARAIADAILAYSGERKTLVYTPLVASAHLLADILNERVPGVARAVDGSTPRDERRALLQAHDRGDFRILTNCQVLTEGYDSPGVSCIAVARPTKSRALYAQMLGRGLRCMEGKPNCLLLDFVSATMQHSLIGPTDVLAEDLHEAPAMPCDVDELDVLDYFNSPPPGSARQDLYDEVEPEETQAEVEYDVVDQYEAARRQAVADYRDDPRMRRAYSPEDFWRVMGWRVEDWRVQLQFGGRPPTKKQCNALLNCRIKIVDGLTRGAASILLDVLISRIRARRATVPQVMYMSHLGLSAFCDILALSFDEAGVAITWARQGFRPETRPAFCTRMPSAPPPSGMHGDVWDYIERLG